MDRFIFDELISMFTLISYMQREDPFDRVPPSDNKEAYRVCTKHYLEWLHDPNCDTNYNKVLNIGKEERRVTFMRDDSIGDPKNPQDDDLPNVQEIDTTEGTDVFFPVYYFHSSIGEKDQKELTCKTPEDCMRAAQEDLRKIRTNDKAGRAIYARISVNGKQEAPVVSNLDDYFVTIGMDSPFSIKVGEHRLNREPEFRLKPGTHQGVVLGTFVYLRNFKKGEYVLKFGGEASNFITHSKYTMHVK